VRGALLYQLGMLSVGPSLQNWLLLGLGRVRQTG
jgi:hypothetical protein